MSDGLRQAWREITLNGQKLVAQYLPLRRWQGRAQTGQRTLQALGNFP